MLGINIWAVIIATIAQFILGAIWYMPLFGKLWGQIHGFNKLSKKEQSEAQKSMMPLLLVQFVITFLTSLALAKLIALAPEYSAYKIAGIIWLGFFVPVQIGAVIFGGTEPKWFVKKIAVMSGSSLINIFVAAAIISAMQ